MATPRKSKSTTGKSEAPALRQRLASALGRRDQEPNVALAETIASANDRSAVADLVSLLASRDRPARGDAIKVLYEIAARSPALVATHVRALLGLLPAADPRLTWGLMTALDAIAGQVPIELAAQLPALVAAGRRGSVIARDHLVGILAQLSALPTQRRRAWPLLLAELRECPDLQFAMYCERSAAAATAAGGSEFAALVAARQPRLAKDSQRRRVAKLLAGLNRGAVAQARARARKRS